MAETTLTFSRPTNTGKTVPQTTYVYLKFKNSSDSIRLTYYKNNNSFGAVEKVSFANASTYEKIKTINMYDLVSRLISNKVSMNKANGLLSSIYGTGDRDKYLVDPVILDLNGDNQTSTIGIEDSSVYFDYDNDGFAEKTGWANAEDGLLVRDLNSNRIIDNGSELFGENTKLKNGLNASNGFDALLDLDENGDHKITADDSGFNTLKVWKDSNSNGVTEAGELYTLQQLGITEFNLNDHGNLEWPDEETGNFEVRQANYGSVDGTYSSMIEYKVQIAPYDTHPIEWLDEPEDIQKLPDLASSGNIHTLHQAMIRDTSGQLKQWVTQFSSETDINTRNQLIESILNRWAGVDQIDPSSRGGVVNARKLALLEKYFGVHQDGYIPPADTVKTVAKFYDDIKEEVYAQLMQQTHLSFLYDDIYFAWDDNAAEFKGNFTALHDKLENLLATNYEHGKQILSEFSRTFSYIYGDIDSGVTLLYEFILNQDEAVAWAAASGIAGVISGTNENDNIVADDSDNVVFGRNGDDNIYGLDGNDVLNGGEGNDYIVGGKGNDVFNGGAGDDTLVGYAQGTFGNDTYIFGKGYGHDRVSSYGNGQGSTNILKLLVDPDDIEVTQNDGNLIFRIKETGEQVDIEAYFKQYDKKINKIEFKDGTIWTIDELQTIERNIDTKGTQKNDFLFGLENFDDLVEGLSGSDSLHGLSGNDTLFAGAGRDYADGGSGNDKIYGQDGMDSLFGNGGSDEIFGGEDNDFIFGDKNGEFGSETIGEYGDDKLYGGRGDDQIEGGQGNDLLEGEEGNDILLGEQGNDFLNGGNGKDYLFAGQGNDFLNGGIGEDSLEAGEGDDILDGGSDNDTLSGGIGDDIYTFGKGYGKDTLFEASLEGTKGYDTLEILVNSEDVEVVAVKENTEMIGIRIKETDDLIVLGNYLDDDPKNDTKIEEVQFRNGIVWNQEKLEEKILTRGTDLKDNLFGLSRANDWMEGLGGKDTIYGGGGGNDRLYGGDGEDTLYGGEGNDSLFGEQGSDIIYGGKGNDMLDGAAGDDSLYGNVGINSTIKSGNDTYVFGRGYGQDIVYEKGGSLEDIDTVKLLLNPEEIDVLQYQGSLYFQIKDTGEALKINDYFKDSEYKIERVEFRDGTVWGMKDLESLITTRGTGNSESLYGVENYNNLLEGFAGSDLLVSYDGNDYLYGGEGDDKLQAGEGNDFLDGGLGDDLLYGGSEQDELINGNNGDDTYFWGRGSGRDKIFDYNTTFGSVDVVSLGTGIRPDQIVINRNRLDLEIMIEGTDDILTVTNFFEQSRNYRIEKIEFQDGTSWDVQEIEKRAKTKVGSNLDDVLQGYDFSDDVLIGLAGNDELNGFSGDDMLDGGLGDDILMGESGYDNLIGGEGNDILIGGTGGDLYSFSYGFGKDVIYEDSNSDRKDTIHFTSNINSVDLIVLREEYDLKINVRGTTDELVVKNYFLDKNNTRIENIIFSNGEKWDYLDIEKSLQHKASTMQNDIIWGTKTDDYIFGLDGNDKLYGEAGNDTLDGGSGDDYLNGGEDFDELHGGDGHDTLVSENGSDAMFGDAGNDELSNGAYMFGGTDDDRLTTTFSGGSLYGEDGNDFLSGGSYMSGGSGNDIMRGSIQGSTFDSGDGDNEMIGYAGYDTMYAGSGNDILIGDDGGGNLNAGSGNNYITGGIDSERISSEDGDDYIYALAGDDYVWAGAGTNVIDAGSGNDTVYTGQNSSNQIEGGAGNDSLWGGSGVDRINGGNENDMIWGNAGDDGIDGGDGDDQIWGGEGNNTLIGGLGNDSIYSDGGTIDGGEGNDAFYLSGAVTVDGGAGNDKFYGNSSLTVNGGAGDDEFYGSSTRNDSFAGGYGNDLYNFGLQSGQDQIFEDDSTTNNQDKVNLYLDPELLEFREEGNDLIIATSQSSDELKINDWFEGEAHQVEVFQTQDGHQLLNTQVQQLIQAMATFETNEGMNWSQAVGQKNEAAMQILAEYWKPQQP